MMELSKLGISFFLIWHAIFPGCWDKVADLSPIHFQKQSQRWSCSFLFLFGMPFFQGCWEVNFLGCTPPTACPRRGRVPGDKEKTCSESRRGLQEGGEKTCSHEIQEDLHFLNRHLLFLVFFHEKLYMKWS